MTRPRRPLLPVAALVDDEIARPRRQDLERLQELDDRVLLVRRQAIERGPRRARLAVVRLDRLAERVNRP
jgi:hypothetical protein